MNPEIISLYVAIIGNFISSNNQISLMFLSLIYRGFN